MLLVLHHERAWVLLATEAYDEARESLDEIGDERSLAVVEMRLAALAAPSEPERATALLAAAEEHSGDNAHLLAAHRIYAGHLELTRGHSVHRLLAWIAEPSPGSAAPSPGAWNPEARFAAKLLRRRALEA